MRAHDMQTCKCNEHTQMIMQDYTMMMKSTSLLHVCIVLCVFIGTIDYMHCVWD